MKKIIIICLILAFPLPIFAQAIIDPNFNPERIISDNDLLNYSSMSLPEIQTFLQNKNSFLANYRTLNAHGDIKSAAEIIYDAANNNFDCPKGVLSDNPTEAEKRLKCKNITTINPKFILVTLQKEASLIEDLNPSQGRLDWAMGYGCPDGWVCNPYYKGFGKQVNSMSLQFLAYMNEPNHYNYRAGQTYTISNTLDPYCTSANQTMIVTPQNQATAALYNYTPHVFNGNYNVYKLWDRYFPTSSKQYPDGSILQAKNDTGIWLIENGKKRPFLSYSAFISRYNPSQIIKVETADLDNYQQGEKIKFSNYSLVQTPDKTIYLLVDKEKRQFTNLATFKKIGFNVAEIESATPEDLISYQAGKIITATSSYVTGALLQDIKSGGIFYVENGVKAPLIDKALLTAKYGDKKIIKVSPIILAAYKETDPIIFADGTLLKTDNYPMVYLISNGKKRPFSGENSFTNLGYNFKNVISVSSQFMYLYPSGEAI